MLSVPQAILGGQVEVPTVNGKTRISIQPGTQPDTVLRLRGKGIPEVQGYDKGMRGDEIIKISIYIPESLTREEKESIQSLQNSENFVPTDSIKEKLKRKFRSYFN